MKHTPVKDISTLPTYGFEHRTPLWWGTLFYMVIEGTVMVMALAVYFYLMSQNPGWPLHTPPPKLFGGTAVLTLLLVSEIPNFWIKRVAKRQDLRAVRIGLVLMTLIGLGALWFRAIEFQSLNCRWDSNVYGSVIWMLLFLHTIHILTDVAETLVMAVMMFIGPLAPRRFVSIDENAEYWDFVVLLWVPFYIVIYWIPRWVGG